MRTTPVKILDAGEKLFSKRTYDAVTVRDITSTAGVTLALMSYHFGTKEALFEAVVARRAELLGHVRRDRLAVITAREAYTIEDVLDAYLRPMFEFARGSDRGWRNYISVLTQLGRDGRWGWLLDKYFDETAQGYLDALRACAPGISPVALARGFLYCITIMLDALSANTRLATLSRGRLGPDDVDAGYPQLLAFASGGLRSLNKSNATPNGVRNAAPGRSRPGGSARKKSPDATSPLR